MNYFTIETDDELLALLNVPINYSTIKTRAELFISLDVPIQYMTFLLYKKGAENLYYTFEIPKKHGGTRIINCPDERLKAVQKKLAKLLWKRQERIWAEKKIKPKISHAFEKRKSIITNAMIHRNRKFILNVDLAAFFPSIHFGRVRGFFAKNIDFKLPDEVALIIAQIACYKGYLPQGAPSSPIISNLICQTLDINILKLAKKYKVNYTRYADDLTFSTNHNIFPGQVEKFLAELKNKIEKNGFKINTEKTRLQFYNSRQTVTGLIVNKKINVPREYYKQTRAMANTLYKTGAFSIHNQKGTLNQLEGRFAYINQLDKYNNKLQNNKNNRQLNSREKEYQKFLFYKYFYNNEKPLVVTEGKTDILYLKAALKNLYKNYPSLIEKVEEKYFFKISFLRRTKRLKYFLNFHLDGGDEINKLYNCYIGKGGWFNYLKYFQEKIKNNPKNPVFFIFDNEMLSEKQNKQNKSQKKPSKESKEKPSKESKEKPLKKFLGNISNDEDDGNTKEQKLKEDLFLNITDNLYLLTHQLIDGNNESEIEDLFTAETLRHEMDGKKFNKNFNTDSTESCYGKTIFSKYVLKNYNKIDFTNFRPILDNLSHIIENYKQK